MLTAKRIRYGFLAAMTLIVLFFVLTACRTSSRCAHTIVTDPGREATCTAEGLSEGKHCSKCGEVLVKQEILPAKGHTVVTEKGKTATCLEEGLSDRIYCSECGEVFQEAAVLPKTGHSYQLSTILTSSQTTDRAGIFCCSVCQETMEESITCRNAGIPVLSFTGSFKGITKTEKQSLPLLYDGGDISFRATAVLKVQGASSAGYPKKNYTIQLLEPGTEEKLKVELADGWGRESKYCLKANYIDASQARNVVSGKVFGDAVHLSHSTAKFEVLPNGGAVDGFPVLVFLNNEFYGLFTLNIPKDEWMFGMEEEGPESRQAILKAASWDESVFLGIHLHHNVAASGWEMVYCSTADEPEVGDRWVADSFNELVDVLNAETIDRAELRKHLDISRTIDVMLFTFMTCAGDNVAKNILWVTYDGVKWAPSIYDMDDSWGLVWDGQSYYSPTSMNPEKSLYCKAFEVLYNRYRAQIITRYDELRSSVWSKESIRARFKDFFDAIPQAAVEADAVRWPGVPSRDTNNFSQIAEYLDLRFAYLDPFFNYTEKERGE